MPAQITVSRTSPDDVKLRQILVKLDGQQVAELLAGDSVTLPVTAGHHLLRVDNTWNWKTVEFDLADGEHARFTTLSRAGSFSWFLLSAFGAGPIYVSIHRDS